VTFFSYSRQDVLLHWADDIEPELRRAVAVEGKPLREVFWELASGESEAFRVVTGAVTGIVVVTLGVFDGVMCCWLNYVAGSIDGGPRQFISAAREIATEIETLARKAGCIELRGGGRNWSRVFPEWEHFDPDNPNRMRKRLDG